MLLTRVTAEGIRDGSVTAVFRRWDAPRVRPGGTQRTIAGVVRFESIEPVSEAQLTDADARAAGMASLVELQAANRRGRGARLYRIGTHHLQQQSFHTDTDVLKRSLPVAHQIGRHRCQ